jgi:hypothetical protein
MWDAFLGFAFGCCGYKGQWAQGHYWGLGFRPRRGLGIGVRAFGFLHWGVWS